MPEGESGQGKKKVAPKRDPYYNPMNISKIILSADFSEKILRNQITLLGLLC
jgi:hypothetical protein